MAAKKFKELQAKKSPERRARIEARVQAAIAQMALDELREARKLTQAQLANTLKVDQGSVSKLERRTDMYVSTLRNFIRAMGGELTSGQISRMARWLRLMRAALPADTQRSQRVPSAGSTGAILKRKVDLAGMLVLQQPGAFQ